MNENLFYRSFQIDRSQINEKNKSVEVSLSSETPVTRWFGPEILIHTDDSIDLSRLNSALLNHNPDNIVGRFENVRLEKKKTRGTLIFDDDEIGNSAFKKVLSGSLKGVSIGYLVEKFKELEADEEWEGFEGPAYLATKFSIYEGSLTPIPADPTVGVGRSRSLDGIEIEKSKFNLKEDKQMDEKEVQTMIDKAFEKVPETVKGIVPEIVSQVRETLVDDAKPKMKIENDVFQDLLGRAGAVSLGLKAKVADMAVEGKTEQEITRAILDEAITDPNANDNGDLDNGTGLKNKNGNNHREIITSFEKVEDDDFFRGLSNPVDMPLQ